MNSPVFLRQFDGFQPGRLWSLSDMLKKAAALFSAATGDLLTVEQRCLLSITTDPTDQYAELGGAIHDHAVSALQDARVACVMGDLDNLLPALARLDQMMVHTAALEDIRQGFRHFRQLIQDELENDYFFHVDRRDVSFYGQKELFGPKVADKFANASEDIEEAGNCIALQRPTAAVFHLMRAMEVAVKALSAALQIANTDRVWGMLLSDMHGKINAMPKDDPKRDQWSLAHANLYHVKQAWRNDVMHPKATYTADQAREVFSAVRVFTIQLADLV